MDLLDVIQFGYVSSASMDLLDVIQFVLCPCDLILQISNRLSFFWLSFSNIISPSSLS
jgi:hypothetical protein